MPPRRLSPEEAQLWGKVVASVNPLRTQPKAPLPSVPEEAPAPPAKVKPAAAASPRPAPPPAPKPKPTPGTTLDATWDRRLSRVLVSPDYVLDLHGHNLSTAYDLLDSRLEFALAAEARLLLLVTGKPPGEERPVKRGAIRAAVGDWLAASRHAGQIAAVRNAHPRHGGAGALYIVLRRRR
ncbi:MAG TPA: Smr/MutS family protein [Allosphingosinicella sp.]|jgi:DNA-nicking Smr family endonuclease